MGACDVTVSAVENVRFRSRALSRAQEDGARAGAEQSIEERQGSCKVWDVRNAEKESKTSSLVPGRVIPT